MPDTEDQTFETKYLALANENAFLKKRIEELEAKLSFLTKHKTLARGLAGERLISDAITGALTGHTASFDVSGPQGERIEVKSAKLTNAGAGAASEFRRWMWQKVFGETNQKTYDYLLLVGEAHSACASAYRDPDSPYVLFCIPHARVGQLTTAGTRGALGIQLNCNPATARGRSRSLFNEFQITLAELQERFGSIQSDFGNQTSTSL